MLLKRIVVTNNHVIANADDIVVIVNNKEYEAKVLGADPYADVAVLQIESKETFTPVQFGDSDKARVGDWVVAIGNPFGLGGTVTSGIISARNRDINLTRYDDFIQTDASINQGNSGGPLFNLDGQVIGINTAILSPSGTSSGIGFAIPANAASNIINQLIKFGETKRGWLGVRIQQVTKEIAEVQQLKEPNGALIAGVSEGSPAEKSGIKPGDIILEFDGKKIKTMRNLPKIVANTEVGKNVNVKIWRNKKLISKQLVLGRLESSKEFLAENKKIKKPKYVEIEKLKISIRDLTSDDIDQRGLDKNLKGVVITEISSKSPLSFLLTSGDIIVELQSQAIKNTKDLEKVSKNISKSSEKTLLIRFINKRNQPSYGTVKIK